MINKNYLLAVVALVAIFTYQFSAEETGQSLVVEDELAIKDHLELATAPEVVEKPLASALNEVKVTEQFHVLEDGIEGQTQEPPDLNEAVDSPSKSARNSLDTEQDFIKHMDAELKQAAKDGDWATFELLVEEVKLKLPKHAYSFALDLAIRANAPLYVIEDLVAKGGQFSYRHVYSMAKFNRHEYYYELKSLGLDVHLKGPDGQNALYPAMSDFKENNVFFSLLLDGVDPNIEFKGKRLVDRCLERIINHKQGESIERDERYWSAVGYFRQLIRYGKAELLPHHLTLLNKIRQSSPTVFDLMTLELPNKSDLLYRLDQL